MISGKALARFGGKSPTESKPELTAGEFDMEGYLAKHGFEVVQRKPWNSNPGGQVYELAQCPFNADHLDGSAAFTMLGGQPGFGCKHNGCQGKSIKDVFAKYPVEHDEKLTQAQILIDLAAEAQLFHTPQSDAFARISVGGHREIWMLRSKGFRQWVIRRFYQIHHKPPGSQALQDALGVLEAKARFDGSERSLSVRVAAHEDRIFFDLCNDEWQAVEISNKGWRVVDDSPVPFRRAKGMLALPKPVAGGSIELLRTLINIGDDNNWILCASWLVAACRPTGPYPILILQGEQGSAKSTTEKLLRRIIDPSAALVRTPPRDGRDLLITAANSWLIAYDNLSGIPQWLSDSLCRLATGGGFSTRELYSDSEEVFFDATRPVVVNGIDQLADRADLADRALVLHLPHIENKTRRDEAQLYAEFERALPQILGALFTAVSAALRQLPQTHIESKPRMADFALWATAAEQELGFQPGAFIKAYEGNRADAIQETLEGDQVGAAILALIAKHIEENESAVWEGTCKDLLSHLERFIDEGAERSRGWPKTPRGLSGRLRRLVTFFWESGIRITFHPKTTKGQRYLTIVRTSRHSTAASASTATPYGNCLEDESVAAAQVGGGSTAAVAVESTQTIQPPPKDSSANALNGLGNQLPMEVVAEVAVVRREFPNTRVNVCAKCGPVSWEWDGSAWVCPNCGVPDPDQGTGNRRPDIERFEL
jgi:hypothetical protein